MEWNPGCRGLFIRAGRPYRRRRIGEPRKGLPTRAEQFRGGDVHGSRMDARLHGNRSLTGTNQKDSNAMASQNQPGGGQNNQASMPQPARGGTNASGGSQKQGKEGNGAQKRQQKKKT